MKYKIITGKYETGNEEQKLLFANMLGTNVQYKFNLYFHWYNIIHELGHCLLDFMDVSMDNVDEEYWVNRFAIAYWKKADDSGKLTELKEILNETISSMQNPVPQGQGYFEFFKSIWESIWKMDEQQATMLYGYFQFSCVAEAMKCEDDLADLLQTIGIHTMQNIQFEKYQGTIRAENAEAVLHVCMNNLQTMGVHGLEVTLELVENPAIHCANKE